MAKNKKGKQKQPEEQKHEKQQEPIPEPMPVPTPVPIFDAKDENDGGGLMDLGGGLLDDAPDQSDQWGASDPAKTGGGAVNDPWPANTDTQMAGGFWGAQPAHRPLGPAHQNPGKRNSVATSTGSAWKQVPQVGKGPARPHDFAAAWPGAAGQSFGDDGWGDGGGGGGGDWDEEEDEDYDSEDDYEEEPIPHHRQPPPPQKPAAPPAASWRGWSEEARKLSKVTTPSSVPTGPAGTRNVLSSQQHSQILNSLLNASQPNNHARFAGQSPAALPNAFPGLANAQAHMMSMKQGNPYPGQANPYPGIPQLKRVPPPPAPPPPPKETKKDKKKDKKEKHNNKHQRHKPEADNWGGGTGGGGGGGGDGEWGSGWGDGGDWGGGGGGGGDWGESGGGGGGNDWGGGGGGKDGFGGNTGGNDSWGAPAAGGGGKDSWGGDNDSWGGGNDTWGGGGGKKEKKEKKEKKDPRAAGGGGGGGNDGWGSTGGDGNDGWDGGDGWGTGGGNDGWGNGSGDGKDAWGGGGGTWGGSGMGNTGHFDRISEEDEEEEEDYDDPRRVHFSPKAALKRMMGIGRQAPIPPTKNTSYSLPSKTLTHAYKGTTTVLDYGIPHNKMNEYTNVKFIDSRGVALDAVKHAFFGRMRKAKERIYWGFSPDKDERVSSVISWVQTVNYALGSYGLHRFLQSQERGALFVNADYRSPKNPNEPAFDWLTFDELQKTRDKILQESVAFYDPAAQVIVFIFLPSPSGNSVAMWRRRINVPNNIRLMLQDEINLVFTGLRKDKEYLVHVDELPPKAAPGPKQTTVPPMQAPLYTAPDLVRQMDKMQRPKRWWQLF